MYHKSKCGRQTGWLIRLVTPTSNVLFHRQWLRVPGVFDEVISAHRPTPRSTPSRTYNQKTSMYFRRILGKKARSIKRQRMLQGRAIAHDFLAYLADKQKFDEALNVSQVS